MTKKPLISKIDLKFEINWDPVRKFIKTQENKRKFGVSEQLTVENELYYTTWVGDLSADWLVFGGPFLDKIIPGLGKFKKLVEPLNYDGSSFSTQTSGISEHIDAGVCLSQTEQHEIISDRQCKINYIITNENPNTLTTVIDRDDPKNVWTYDSTPHVAWLIDVNHRHHVKCEGYREVISFRFCETFDTVKSFYDEKGPLMF